MADPNQKFLLDEFKRCLSASGFRAEYVFPREYGYEVDVDGYEIEVPQLIKLVELTGTRKITITGGHIDGRLCLQVR